ncbi:MAG: aminodeoxychorismate synthase, component I, partial [Actinobacteria bacterium]|nr:aminodeoxychorismate synthase, component I [Actinomycetota bacterium]
MSSGVQNALIQYPIDGSRHWLSFENPVFTIVAENLRDVPQAICDAQTAAEDGYWVVGMISYDAGPAFDDAIRSSRIRRVPLVSFGVFTSPSISSTPKESGGYDVGPWVPNRSHSAYLTTIRTIRQLIAAGETYQVNHTIRLRSDFSGDPRGLFGDLIRAQQSNHAAFLDLGDRAVCSSSPELFFSRNKNQFTCRPMKGTIGRHPDPVWDELASSHLSRSEKDLAENTMIVDMVRNDLSRIAEPGSVKVPFLHTVESYPTVHTLTSTVTAESTAKFPEILKALFPAASITGAPKVRTTEIIEALEGDGRGIYTGSIGALAPDGTMEFNIAIRTIWIDKERERAEYGVGGGIVWDSDPNEEWREVEQKSRVLDRAKSSFFLLETMRWEPGKGIHLQHLHVDRLTDSANHFGFDLDRTSVLASLLEIRGNEPKRVRLLASPSGSIEVQVLDLPQSVLGHWEVPIDAVPVQSENEFLFHKTTNRDVYEQARARFPNSPDVLLWNERGEITETTTGNLVVKIGSELYTPPVTCGLLPGTFRRNLLEQRKITEKVIHRSDMNEVSSIWMINSLRGWVPLRINEEIAPVALTQELKQIQES